jgi:hypothetical protein
VSAPKINMQKNEKQKYKVVFVVRKINDIDHMLPLIWKMKKTNNNVKVVTFGLHKVDNYLTNYMFSELGLSVETPILNNLNKIFRLLILAFDRISNFAQNNNWHLFVKYVEYIANYLNKRIITHEGLKENVYDIIFGRDNIGAIVVDKTDILKNKIYKNVAKQAVVNNIPIVRLQHGIDMRIINTNTIDGSNILVHDYGDNVFDIYYSMIEVYQESLDCYIECCGKKINKNEIKTSILGNMRFSREWVKKYKEIQKFDRIPYPKVDLKKNTILVLMSATHHIYTDKIADLLNAISDRFDINIIYKPHTRHGEVSNKIKKLLNKKVEIIYSYKCTTALIDVSDVVLLCGVTSVGIHSIVDLKPIIFAEYTSKYQSYYSKYMNTHTFMSKDKVLNNIEIILNNKTDYAKNTTAIESIKEIINPNNSNNIIQEYYDLVSSIIDDSSVK